MPADDHNQVQFRGWLTTEVKIAMAIIVPTVAVLGYLNQITTRQALIEQSIRNMETNHLAHVQDSIDKLEGNAEVDRRDIQQIKESQAEIKAILLNVKK